MNLRTGLLAAVAILGIARLGAWLFARAGFWGTVLIVTLMTIAIVASPIPRAPIALAAGAAYGHLWGTVQVVI